MCLEYKLSELIEMDKLQPLLESFFEITHIPLGIIGLDGDIMANAGWRRICREFHEKSPEASKNCKESNCWIKECQSEKNGYSVVKCKNGLRYIACPIMINEKPVAGICQGQFLSDPQEAEPFKQQGRKYGFDEEEYMKAVNEIPVMGLEEIEPVTGFLRQFAGMLGEMGLRQLTQLEAQKRLKHSEECLKFAIDVMGSGVWDCNIQNEEAFFSDKCKEIAGYDKEDAGFTFNSWYGSIHPDDLERLHGSMKRHFEGKNPICSAEYRLRCKDGCYRWIFMKGKLISSTEDGKPLRMVGIISDISEQKKNEQETVELETLKNEFLANISHELKTPINVIYSASQLFDLYIDSNTVNENIEKIKAHQKVVKQNCYRSQRLINNLIDISRIDSGYFEIRPVNENIVSVIEDIALSVKDHIENNGIAFLFDTDVEEKIIAFDPEKIERVILNLISNAVKFTEPGGTISIGLHTGGVHNGAVYSGEDKIEIFVKDTGVGIPADKLDAVFERFKQVDELFARRSEGSGVGLTLVKSIIEMHGGSIRVESEYGKGSEFIIELPCRVVSNNHEKAYSGSLKGNDQGFIQTVNIEFSDIYSKK